MPARNRKTNQPLQTQKDGRRFAMKLLNSLARMPRVDDRLGATPGDEEDVFRAGPQSVVVLEALDDVYERGTRDAVLGFVSILTDFLGSVMSGNIPDADEYPRRERLGQLEHWMPGNREQRAGAVHT